MSERVKDEELAEIEAARDALRMTGEGARLPMLQRALDLASRLVDELRACRDEDAAIGRMLDEAGITPRGGETLRARVERLIALSNDRMTRLLGADARAEEIRARAEKAEAELAALRAPVDVEGDARITAAKRAQRRAHDIVNAPNDVKHAAAEIRRITGCGILDSVQAVAPHVERAAQLAREAEGLRAELASRAALTWVARAREQDERNESLTLANKIGNDALAAARAEVERLKTRLKELTDRIADERAEYFSRD